MVAASGCAGTDRVGPIPPRWRQATIEKIAANAVMAGCRPEYLPVGSPRLTPRSMTTASSTGSRPRPTPHRRCSLSTAHSRTTSTSMPRQCLWPGRARQCHDWPRGAARAAQYRRRHPRRNRHVDGWPCRKIHRLHRRSRGRQPVDALPCRCRLCRIRQHSHGDRRVAPQNIFTYGCETGQDILDHFIGATPISDTTTSFSRLARCSSSAPNMRRRWRATASARRRYRTRCSNGREFRCRALPSAA